MTAIEDEVRALLDKRGAEYREYRIVTPITMQKIYRFSFEDNDGHQRACIEAVEHDAKVFLNLLCTPVQAVGAILGADPRHPKPHEKWTTVLLPDIAWQDDTWPDYLGVAHEADGEWRAYVPEATLGRVECRRIVKGKKWGDDKFVCSECGYGLGDKRWCYCPKCGAKVIEQ